jgi:hypothetical protein
MTRSSPVGKQEGYRLRFRRQKERVINEALGGYDETARLSPASIKKAGAISGRPCRYVWEQLGNDKTVYSS